MSSHELIAGYTVQRAYPPAVLTVPPLPKPVTWRPGDVGLSDALEFRFAQAVQAERAAGARLAARPDYFTALVTYGKPIHVGLNIALAVLTMGLWLFCWPVVAAVKISGRRRITLQIDELGNVTRECRGQSLPPLLVWDA